LIKVSSPPRFTSETSVNYRRLFDGLISRTDSTGYLEPESGATILDLGERLEEIDLCMSQEYWSTAPVPTIACSSQMDPLYFGDWKGTMTAKLIPGAYVPMSGSGNLPLTLSIKYNNGCELTCQLSLYYRMRDRSGIDTDAQVSINWSGPTDWKIPEPRWRNLAKDVRAKFLGYTEQVPPMLADTTFFMGVMYNSFEDISYPVNADFVNHRLVRELFKKLFQGMNVNFDKVHIDHPYADAKFVYKTVKELIAYYPMKIDENVADDCTTRAFGLSKFLDRGYGDWYCRDMHLVPRSATEGTDEWSRIHPKGDLPSYGTVVEFAAPQIGGRYSCYDCIIVVDDKAETATLHVAYSTHELKDVVLTPRTVHLFLKELERSRRHLLQREGFEYSSGTSITGG
jgi:hypothetical protein